MFHKSVTQLAHLNYSKPHIIICTRYPECGHRRVQFIRRRLEKMLKWDTSASPLVRSDGYDDRSSICWIFS